MIAINFFISIAVILILFAILSSTIKTTLKIFTKYEYQNYYLMLPTFLSLGTWSLVFILWYLITKYLFNIDTTNLVISIILKEYDIITNNLILFSVILIFIGILLQALCIFLVNIDYKKITGNTRFFFKKMLKIKLKEENGVVIKDDPEKLSFLSSIEISIVIFVFLTIFLFILLLIGKLISNKLISNVKIN